MNNLSSNRPARVRPRVMRYFWIILFLLLANLAALFVLVQRTGVGAKAPAAESFAGRKPSPEPVAQRPLPSPEPQPSQAETNSFRWAQLESEDYATYIQRLRTIGCPEQTIRDIIIADLDKLMASRMRHIEGVKEPPKYWKPENKELISAQAALEKLELKQDLDFEKRRVISELLGVDLAAERLRQRGERDIYSERLGFLPEEKLAQVRMVMDAANREELRLRENSWLNGEQLTPEETQRLREIESERREQIAGLLSPEEYERFELWFSPSAYKVREAFFTLEPTEEEFLAVYQLQKEFDQQWSQVDPENPPLALKQTYEDARQELEAGIAEALGPGRYTDLQRARDDDYRELRITAAQFNLPPVIADEVQNYRQILEEHRRQVLSDPGLSAAQRAELLRAFSEEAERSVVQALGPRAYQFYLRSGAGTWISK